MGCGSVLVLFGIAVVTQIPATVTLVAVAVAAVTVILVLVWRKLDEPVVVESIAVPLPPAPEIADTGLKIGSTIAEVIGALGQPDKTDERVFKTKTTHVLKYGPRGRRFALKVKIENGRVAGWEGELGRRPAQGTIERLEE